MPRLLPSVVRRARYINPSLASLLPVCRDLGSAKNELRWLHEHSIKLTNAAGANSRRDSNALLNTFVGRRAKGEPLQYILGSEYFGVLEIKCRPDVLIPRSVPVALLSTVPF